MFVHVRFPKLKYLTGQAERGGRWIVAKSSLSPSDAARRNGSCITTVCKQTIMAKPGTFVFAPPNATHALKIMAPGCANSSPGTRRPGRSGYSKPGQRMGEQGVKDAEVRRKTLAAHDTIFHDRRLTERIGAAIH
jgi:hypothetical protein